MPSITKARRRIKTPPPPPIGWREGRPILAGVLGPANRDGDRSIKVTCPKCGRVNSHGWPKEFAIDKPAHKASHCECWDAAPSGYFVLPTEQTAEVACK